MNWTYAFRDIAKQKTRFFFGVSGIAISIFLLTVVGMIGDSISYSYVDYASQSAGKNDFVIQSQWSARMDFATLEGQVRGDPTLDAIIADVLPRSFAGSWSSHTKQVVNPATGKDEIAWHVGVNLAREANAVQGPFLGPGRVPFTGTLVPTECLMSSSLARETGTSAGDTITYVQTQYTDETRTVISWQWSTNFTVKEIVDLNFKFGESVEDAIIVNITHWNAFYGHQPGDCTSLVLNLARPQDYYNSKDIDGSIEKMRAEAIKIQNRIGFFNTFHGQNALYSISMPRVAILEIEQYVNIGVSIILMFVSILGMVISGVLINGILTTSVEEKIREFGIFRVLGGHRVLPIKITVTQAFILSSVGTGLGLVTGYFTVAYAILPLIVRLLSFTAGAVVPILSTETILTSIGVGMGISMLVGIAPALKVSKMSILGAINPYRQESAGTKMVREESLNVKYIVIGAVMSGNAAFVLFIVPQIILTLDIALIVAVLVILLTVFLMGATLVGLGLLPVVQAVIMRVYTALTRKTKDIIRISLLRYTRRNITTVIMFSISFSFITLVSTVLNTQSAQNIGQVRNTNGADLVFDSRSFVVRGYTPESSYAIPDQTLASDLLAFPGVARTSSILATTRELDDIRGISYSITMSDMVGYKSSGVHGVAVDEDYLETVYTEFVILSQGTPARAFEAIFNGGDNVIISTGLSTSLDLHLDDKCLLRFDWGGESRLVEFTVAGVADNLPGIPTIEKRAAGVMGGSQPAIVLSHELYARYFQLPAGHIETSRIFIKLASSHQNDDKAIELERQIRETYKDTHLFLTYNSFRQGRFMQTIFGAIEALFLVILTFAVVISLFGLSSSAYSTILERTREVGIIETLGLRKKKVSNMFIIESEIIMSSAAINGAIIGILLTWLFYSQLDAFSSFPVLAAYTIPWATIAIELAVAAIVCALTMKLLVRRVQRMELMEIFRKTL